MSDPHAQIESLIFSLQTSHPRIVAPLWSLFCIEIQAWLVLLCLQFRRTYQSTKEMVLKKLFWFKCNTIFFKNTYFRPMHARAPACFYNEKTQILKTRTIPHQHWRARKHHEANLWENAKAWMYAGHPNNELRKYYVLENTQLWTRHPKIRTVIVKSRSINDNTCSF